MNAEIKSVLVTGGAGYVGAVLVPKLLAAGYRVAVLDLYLFGDDVLPKGNPALAEIRGDIRDADLLRASLRGMDAVIHLACISNDPSFELALTDYNKYKGMCEPILARYQSDGFTTVTIRPATVCGYSPRLRLDLTVNILTNLAVNTRRITIFGGTQKRPNIHIEDIADLYVDLLAMPAPVIAGKIFNCGYENHTVRELGEMVRRSVVQEMPDLFPIKVTTSPSNDLRSYHISSEKIARELGFKPKRTVEDAVGDLCRAFRAGKIPDPMTDIRYYNVKAVQAAKLA